MPTVHRDSTFTGIDIELTDNEYHGCVFTRCKIIFRASGKVVLTGCQFHESFFAFEGAASDTIGFMRAIYQMGEGGQKVVKDTFAQITKDA